jgi:hypothetical protein
LSHPINSATKTQNNSSTAPDNIFVGRRRLNSSSTHLIINGLLDNNGQFITINYTAATANLIPFGQRTRKINKGTVMLFQLLLKNETLEYIYKSNNTNNKFTLFCILF